VGAGAGAREHASCHDFQTVREVVLCRAWDDVRSRRAETFRQAVEDGWGAVRSACAAHGGTRPEFGFLEAVAEHGGVPRVINAYEVRDQHGSPVGVVVELSDGTADACFAGACHEFPSVSAALASLGGARGS